MFPRAATTDGTAFDPKADSGSEPAVTVGPPDPDIPALKGRGLDSSTLGGREILLNFWATWCPPCKKEPPSIETLHKKLQDERFDVVSISVQEKRAAVEDFPGKTPYTFPVYLDESGAVSVNCISRGIPTTFFLDEDARVIAAVIGSIEYDSAGMPPRRLILRVPHRRRPPRSRIPLWLRRGAA